MKNYNEFTASCIGKKAQKYGEKLHLVHWANYEELPKKGQNLTNTFDYKFKVVHVERKERIVFMLRLEQ